MDKNLFNEKVNYVEIYVINKKYNNSCIDTNLSDTKFNRILENVKKLRFKNFKKSSTKTFNSRMEYIAEDNNETVYEFNILDSQILSKNNLDFMNLKIKKNKKQHICSHRIKTYTTSFPVNAIHSKLTI